MSRIMIEIPPEANKRLQEQARREGKTIEALTREFIEAALQAHQQVRAKTARDALQAAGRVRPLSETLRRKIIRDVSLDEVRLALAQAAGPSLSDLILEQRGPNL